ncbi:MAG TPA: deoxyribonuclease IV [Candidatus Babeliales bacterium]|jgi:deoxyribonuclease-4|nr:deoxyribonuclease IV [Candidatus Babeliales bacterium]
MPKRVGLHVRVHDSLVAVAQQAIDLSLPFFQSFLFLQYKKRAVIPSSKEIDAFRMLSEKHFKTLFAHGSFWLNLALSESYAIQSFKRELALAKALGFTHLILHTGVIEVNKQQSIKRVADTINIVMRKEDTITLVLENTAHGDHLIGSDLHDFVYLRSYLDFPERVQFCIDTAHAHAYGYQLDTPTAIDMFIDYIDQQLGLDSIVLLHLNDVVDPLGSKIDRHAMLGQGLLGANLHYFATHNRVMHIPIILELPNQEPHMIHDALQLARTWCNE